MSNMIENDQRGNPVQNININLNISMIIPLFFSTFEETCLRNGIKEDKPELPALIREYKMQNKTCFGYYDCRLTHPVTVTEQDTSVLLLCGCIYIHIPFCVLANSHSCSVRIY